MKHLILNDSGRLLSFACGCLALASCQTGSMPPSPVATARYQPAHWTKVAAKPPTYYPRGVSADAPVDFDEGEWFRVRDAADTRYFIPFKVPDGPGRESLVSEVCSLRTDDYYRQIDKYDAAERKDQVARKDQVEQSVKFSPEMLPLYIMRFVGELILMLGRGAPI